MFIEDENEKEGEITIKQEVLSDEDKPAEEFSVPQNITSKRKSINDVDKDLRVNVST